MSAPAAALLALAAVAALVDWWAVSVQPPRLPAEYLAKPATLVFLLLAATVLRPAAGEGATQVWFLPALVLCLAGDVLLMLPGERRSAFAGGLAAFLGAHACFLVGLATGRATLGSSLVAALVLAVAAAGPLALVLAGVARHLGRPMVPPVCLYVAALLAMAAAAWSAALARHPAGAAPLLAAGGTLFVASDTLLSFDRFVRRLPRGPLLVHVTYHLAVAALVVGLV
jgi:uncharacterized membrane protein YhhN